MERFIEGASAKASDRRAMMGRRGLSTALFFAVSLAALALFPAGAFCDDDGAELAALAGKEAARLSRLPEPEPVESHIVTDKETLLEILREDLKREYPAGRMKALQLVSEKLGFYLKEIETDEQVIRSQADAIAGFYNHEDKVVYILDPALQEQLQDEMEAERVGCPPATDRYPNPVYDDWLKKNSNKIVLVHEMTHVVEDQQYDLTAWMDQYKANTDSVMGIKTVVEGLAKYAESNYMYLNYFEYYREEYWSRYFKDYYGLLLLLREEEREGYVEYSDQVCGEFVSFMYQMSLFPYRYGAGLVDRVKAKRGWEGVHDLFYDFPLSTEQVLHPEKFLDEKKIDRPTFIEAPNLREYLPEDYEFLDTDSMGEFRMYILLKDLLFEPPAAMRISEGWDGDRYVAFYNEEYESVIFAWTTIWDSESDARDFFSAYKEIAGRKLIGEQSQAVGKDELLMGSVMDQIYAKIEGNKVVVVEGLEDRDAIMSVAFAMLSANAKEATYDDAEVFPEWYSAPEETLANDGE